MNMAVALIGAIAIGVLIQAFTTYKQASAFSAAVRELRKYGSVSVGGAGKRYRGGKSFVAIAADDAGTITKAISLKGWTTFARPIELTKVRGLRLSQLRGDRPLRGIEAKDRWALQNAAETLHKYQTAKVENTEAASTESAGIATAEVASLHP